MGLESASEVPIEIRNCWSTIEDDLLAPDDAPNAIGGRSYTGKSFSSSRRSCGPPGPRGEAQEDNSSDNAVLAIAALQFGAEERAGGSSATGTGKPTTEPSDFFSFGSEDMSDAGGTVAADGITLEGIRGVGNSVGDGSMSNNSCVHRAWTPAIGSLATPGSSGRANGGSTACWSNKYNDLHQSPLISVGVSGPNAGGAPGSYTGSRGPASIPEPRTNVLLDSACLQPLDTKTTFSLDDNMLQWDKGATWGTPGSTGGDAWHCNLSHATALEGLPSHMRDSTTRSKGRLDGASATSMWDSPASLLHVSSPCHAHMQQQPQTRQQPALNGPNAANYAAVLRCAAQPGASLNPNAQPHSPTGAKGLTNEVIHAHLDSCGREVHSLLSPAVLESVCDAVRRAAPRLNAPGLLQVCTPVLLDPKKYKY